MITIETRRDVNTAQLDRELKALPQYVGLKRDVYADGRASQLVLLFSEDPDDKLADAAIAIFDAHQPQAEPTPLDDLARDVDAAATTDELRAVIARLIAHMKGS